MLLNNEDLDRAKEIQVFLEKNFQGSYNYECLSRKFAINKFKMKLAFKAVTKENIHAFVTRLRIEHAKKLLETTDLSIGLISAQVGLDKSNLNIQFQKNTGKTPAQWRKDPTPNFKIYYHE